MDCYVTHAPFTWRENGPADQLKALAAVLEGTVPENDG